MDWSSLLSPPRIFPRPNRCTGTGSFRVPKPRARWVTFGPTAPCGRRDLTLGTSVGIRAGPGKGTRPGFPLLLSRQVALSPPIDHEGGEDGRVSLFPTEPWEGRQLAKRVPLAKQGISLLPGRVAHIKDISGGSPVPSQHPVAKMRGLLVFAVLLAGAFATETFVGYVVPRPL